MSDLGIGLDDDTQIVGDGSGPAAYNSVVGDICRAETRTWMILTEAMEGRDPRVVLEKTGWLSTKFTDGLISHGQRYRAKPTFNLYSNPSGPISCDCTAAPLLDMTRSWETNRFVFDSVLSLQLQSLLLG